MKKTLFNIDSQEKQRILEMHQNATNRLYLNEQEVTKQTPTPKPIDNKTLSDSYGKITRIAWPLIHNKIAITGTMGSQGETGLISWTYPKDTKDTISVYTNGVLDNTKKTTYDEEFMKRLNTALNDTNWLNDRVSEINNSLINIKDDITPFQTYIMNNIKNKDLVKDNGSGGEFNDGQFGIVTLKAFINYVMQKLNNLDSEYLIKTKQI